MSAISTSMTIRKPSLAAVVRAEILKFWTLPAARRFVLVAVASAAVMGAVFCATIAVTQGRPLASFAPREVVSAALIGVDFAAVATIVAAAVAVASEYLTGSIVLTLAATPQRGRVLLAKTVTAGLIAIGVGLVSAILAFAAANLVLAIGGLPLASPIEPGMPRLLAGTALGPLFYALTATGFAVVFRSAVGGVLGASAVLLVPGLVGMLPVAVRAPVMPLLPVSGLHSLAGLSKVGTPEHLGGLAAVAVLVVWTAIVLAIAAVRMSRRDA